MNKLFLHKPGFVDGKTESPLEFESTEDLLNLDAVKQFKQGETLFRISGDFLLAVYDKGFEWWVVGSILNTKTLDLFEWDGPKERTAK